MALAQEAIEPEVSAPPAGRSSFSSRPVVLVAVVASALLLLAMWAVLRQDKEAEPEQQAAKARLLVPDRQGAQQVQQSAAPKAPRTTLSATAASQPSPYPNGLGVTSGPVPQIPGDTYVSAGPGASTDMAAPALSFGGSPFQQAATAQLSEHALALQKWQLDLRKGAFSGSSTAPAFAEMRKQQQTEMNELLQGMGGRGEASQESAFMQAAGPSLAMLASARGAGGAQGGDGYGLGGPAGSSPTANGADPQMSQAKLAFFGHGGDQLEPGKLDARVKPQSSPYELQMGSVIPGILISGIHSDAPGQIIGQVSEHVLDSATGRYLLIPQGSRLVGTYSAVVSQGQSRVQIAWVRLNFPNGSTLDLGGMPGADQAGTAGFEDRINRHFARRLAAALMTSSLTVAYEMTAPMNGGLTEGAVHRGVGESIVQLGADMARQEGQLPPTLEIRAGYRFLIHVTKDISFPEPYEDGIDRRVSRR